MSALQDSMERILYFSFSPETRKTIRIFISFNTRHLPLTTRALHLRISIRNTNTKNNNPNKRIYRLR